MEAKRSIHRSHSVVWMNSLQIRFAGALVLLALCILGGFIIYEYNYTKKESILELEELAQIAANRMSKYLVDPLWGLEEAQLNESLVSEMMNKQVYCILIYEEDTSSILIGKTRDDPDKIIDSMESPPADYIKSKRPIVRKQDLIGEVEVFVTTEYAIDKLKKSILKFVFTTCILCISILTAVFFILRNLILFPIRMLTVAADQMSLGKLNTPIGYRTKNEIGILVDAIKRMQDSLQIAITQV